MRAQTRGRHPDLGAALEHLLSSGGKRVRVAVALLTGGMLGADTERLITLSAAIELLHTATLVHDDLIDGSLLRRGNATLNAQWSPAATVLTGDYIFARAAVLAAETDSVSVMRLFAETLATIVNGEITQLFSSHGLASRENYDQRIYAKTASMFELAAAAAAMLSPVPEAVVEQARSFGYQIGMAFQIVDDVLDFTGEQATVGKPVASDLRQGLITLPALSYLQTYPEDEDIQAIISGNGYNDRLMDRLVVSIRRSGAIEQSMEEARTYIGRGLEILAGLPAGIERKALENLAGYIVDRSL
ncbi:MAG TPA: polyprenyl synthetase family protein [Anaerolineales bacterium]